MFTQEIKGRWPVGLVGRTRSEVERQNDVVDRWLCVFDIGGCWDSIVGLEDLSRGRRLWCGNINLVAVSKRKCYIIALLDGFERLTLQLSDSPVVGRHIWIRLACAVPSCSTQ